MKPYIIEELWKLSSHLEPVFDEKTQVVTIDNFFANAEDIYDHLSNQPVPMEIQ